MSRSKIDGIIEAVRYAPDGNLSVARVYERYGLVWSERKLLQRKDLLDLIKSGKHFVTGTRKEYLGSRFDTRIPVDVSGEHIVTGGQSGSHDILSDVPLF